MTFFYKDPKEVYQTLLASIDHWKQMLTDPNCTEGPNGVDCPFCRLFSEYGCSNVRGEICPVAVYADKTGCHNTPFYEDRSYWYTRKMEELKVHWEYEAKEEINFLKTVAARLYEEVEGK